jgi:hypothetical protein
VAALGAGGSVLLAAAAVTALARSGPWARGPGRDVPDGPAAGRPRPHPRHARRRRAGRLPLELNALLGYDAIVAGRFTGYGNLASGLLATSALVATAVGATALGRWAGRDDGGSRQRRVTGAAVLAAGAVTVVLVGAPGLGRDFGGVLAALPGFLLLAMLLTGVRVTPVRLGAVLAAGVLAVGSLAVLDWLRPADERSHLGRFVEQVGTGEAWTVVSRKAGANVDILLGSALAWLLPVALVAAVWLVRAADPAARRGCAGRPRAAARRRVGTAPGRRRGAALGPAGRRPEPGPGRRGQRLRRGAAGHGRGAAGAAARGAGRADPGRRAAAGSADGS